MVFSYSGPTDYQSVAILIIFQRLMDELLDYNLSSYINETFWALGRSVL